MRAPDDRQVLVVGDDVAGLAVTATLRQAGYDPVLLAVDDRDPLSRLATLHPVGRSLFDRLTAGIDCITDETPVALATNESDSRVGVAADSVDAGLGATVPTDAVRTDGLRSLERDGGALRVQFTSGVREWFDLVVAVDGPGSTVRSLRDSSVETVETMQVEARLTTRGDVTCGRESWDEDGLHELLPYPAGDALVRVTTDRPVADSPTTQVRGTLARFGGVDVCELTDTVTRTVTQASADGQWADGKVAYCGSAAFPQAPATGLRTTLALADARVLADELLAGPSSVATTVGSYARRRRGHVRAIRESACCGTEADAVAPGDPLAAIRRDRSAGVGSCDALAGVDRL